MMCSRQFVCALALFVSAGDSLAHGPMIQTTKDNLTGKIVTRMIVDDENYTTALTPVKRVYVMPLKNAGGSWLASPDGGVVGPGFAYGYGYDPLTNPAPFPVGSQFVLRFTDMLKKWDGSDFVDAGVTEAEALRGSSLAPSATATTSDIPPYNGLMFPPNNRVTSFGISFNDEGDQTHNTVSYRMLGDGTNPQSILGDGIYLLSMRLLSTNSSVLASDPYYFLLHRNAGGINGALGALGFDPILVQTIPEPVPLLMATCLLAVLVLQRTAGR